MSVLCGESAALGASLGVGPAPKVVCRNMSATPPSSPFLLGTASPWSNLAAIPPHLCREESRQKCSGQPGCSRPGCWRRQCQSSQICSATYVAAQNPRCPPQTAPVHAPHQRQCVVPLFDCLCQFAKTVISRITVSAALTGWAVPAQAPEAVCPNPSLPVFAGGREPKVSRPWSRQSQSALPHQTASGATLHFVPRPWSLGDSKPGFPHQGRGDIDRRSPPDRPALETPSNQGPQADVRFSHSAERTAITRPKGTKRV